MGLPRKVTDHAAAGFREWQGETSPETGHAQVEMQTGKWAVAAGFGLAAL